MGSNYATRKEMTMTKRYEIIKSEATGYKITDSEANYKIIHDDGTVYISKAIFFCSTLEIAEKELARLLSRYNNN